MVRIFLALGSFFGFTGIILGTISSHVLQKTTLTPEQITTFKLGVQYQMYHAIALVVVAVLCYLFTNKLTSNLIKITGVLFTFGIIFFSGTLYAITWGGLPNIGTAPIGGFALIIGWFLLLIAAFTISNNK